MHLSKAGIPECIKVGRFGIASLILFKFSERKVYEWHSSLIEWVVGGAEDKMLGRGEFTRRLETNL